MEEDITIKRISLAVIVGIVSALLFLPVSLAADAGSSDSAGSVSTSGDTAAAASAPGVESPKAAIAMLEEKGTYGYNGPPKIDPLECGDTRPCSDFPDICLIDDPDKTCHLSVAHPVSDVDSAVASCVQFGGATLVCTGGQSVHLKTYECWCTQDIAPCNFGGNAPTQTATVAVCGP